jgi:hypothetical protein
VAIIDVASFEARFEDGAIGVIRVQRCVRELGPAGGRRCDGRRTR